MQPTSQGNEFAFVTMAVKKKKKKNPSECFEKG